MNILTICVAMAVLGPSTGWQRLPEGGMEYIIQLDAETLEALRVGETIQSDVPPAAGEIRAYRIVVGTKELPHEMPPVAPPTMPPSLTSDASGKPLPAQPALFVEPKSLPAAENPQPDAAAKSDSEQPGKPWLPLMFTLLGLFASLAANAYLGWIALDLHKRWQKTQQIVQWNA